MSARQQAALLTAAAAAGAAVLAVFPPWTYSIYPPCPLRMLTGLACPFCGSTRALAALLTGRFAEAVRYNALTVALLPFAVIFASRGIWVAVRWNRWAPAVSPRIGGPFLALAVLFGIARNLAPRLLGP